MTWWKQLQLVLLFLQRLMSNEKFSTSLFIYCGSLSYEFIYRNLSHALPSLRTVQTIVSNEFQPIEEGAFRFDALLHHLGLYDVDSKIVSIGEDATCLISRIEYNKNTDLLDLYYRAMMMVCLYKMLF